MTVQSKTYWLVGASEGLGLALAHALIGAGARVVISARDAARLHAAAAQLGANARAVVCDVADAAHVQAAAKEVGPIDGVVFLAGVYWPMPAQSWNAEQITAMCDVNFTGCARVLGAVMSVFIAQNRGHIVITGSIAGFRGLPGAMGYGASKAGVMALAESLYADLRGTGVKVQLVNPGFIRTRLTDKNGFAMPFIMPPEAAAQIMLNHMQSTRFKCSFPTAFSWVFRLSQFLPDWAYYPLFAPKSARKP